MTVVEEKPLLSVHSPGTHLERLECPGGTTTKHLLVALEIIPQVGRDTDGRLSAIGRRLSSART